MDLAARPELSVIIVNWNTREMTLACLASLYAETTATSFEVILVDNGSHDGSAAAIAVAFPQVRLLAESENHGFAKANNIAADIANGEFLLLLNSDTVVLDKAVDRLVAFARETPDAGIWGGRTVFANGTLNPGSAWGKPTLWSTVSFALGLMHLAPNSALFNPEGMGGWKRDTRRQVDIVSGCFFLIKAELWQALSGFDPVFFMYGEEADLCARARARGVRPMITPEATIIHYGSASTSKFAHKIVYTFGAKIGLLNRQLTSPARELSRGFLQFGAWWRAALYGVAVRIAPGRFAASAAAWRDAWRRRAEWREGPPGRAIRTE